MVDASGHAVRGCDGQCIRDIPLEPDPRPFAPRTASDAPDAGPRRARRARKTLTRWAKAHLGGSEHATAAAHVSERTLARAVGTTTGDTRNAGDGATGTPGLGGGLVTGALVHGVRLAVVLVEAGVNGVHDVRTDGGQEDLGELHGVSRALHRDGGESSRHVAC